MQGQTKNGLAAEGTQYALNNSFYALDSVPGAGVTLQGPVTIAGNLTTTGNANVIGDFTAASVNAPVLASQQSLAISGAVAVNIIANTGPAQISSTDGFVTVASLQNSTFISGSSVSVTASGSVGPGNATVQSVGSGTATLSSGTGTAIVSSGSGSQFVRVNATGVTASPTLTCPSYKNTNVFSSAVTRTAASAITAGFAQLPLDALSSPQLQIPVGPLYSGGCIPQILKVKITNLTFGSIASGSCNPANPFTIYFYQGNSTSWDIVSSKALATFTYTNQIGAISVIGSYFTIPEVNIPFINAGQLDPAGGDIKVWYYSYFTGFFGPPGGPQATFDLSVVL